MKKPTLVVLSGGMDSTVLAYHLKASPDHKLVGAVSINYGQRHVRELECAKLTALRLEVPHFVLNIPSLGNTLDDSALTGDEDVPHGHYAAETMKKTVVPNRNMILLALAIGVGINNGAKAVAYGAHAGDHAIYPDCRPEFADAMNVAAGLCDFEPRELIRPFITITKADIVRRGLKLGVPFEDTHTCYEGKAIACGKCGTCVERLEAFDLAEFTDPLEYEDREYYRDAIEAAQANKTV